MEKELEGSKVSPQKIEDGGPAFPTNETATEWSENRGSYVEKLYSAGGMTLRAYFAANALQGLLSNPMVVGYSSITGWAPVNCEWKTLSEAAAHNADNLIAALGVKNG